MLNSFGVSAMSWFLRSQRRREGSRVKSSTAKIAGRSVAPRRVSARSRAERTTRENGFVK